MRYDAPLSFFRQHSARRLAAIVLLAAAASLEHSQAGAQTFPLGPLEDGRISYFIAPPPTDPQSRAGDEELALWALESWQRAGGGQFQFVAAADEQTALVRVYWAAAAGGQYGEMRPLEVGGRRGAAVYIRPDTAAFGDPIAQRASLDALFRDTIVYLTCLHELGHALGLEHTDEYADIMYFFGFGGDIPEYFGRYRRELGKRVDIRGVSGLSPGDRAQLRALYGAPVTQAALVDGAN